MVVYNPSNLDKLQLFTDAQVGYVNRLNSVYPLSKLLVSKNLKALAIDFIHASAQIEGNTYDQFDTETLLTEGQTAGGKPFSDARMIINLRDAFNMVIDGDYEIDRSFLFKLHGSIADGELPDNQLGVVRDEAVAISGSSYIPPTGKDYLHAELRYLLEQSAKCPTSLDKAVYLHLNLAYLQYFRDGNKRTARMVQTATLIKGGLVPLLFTKDSITEYRRSLVTYYETGDASLYVKWFVDSYSLMYGRLSPPESGTPIRSF